MSALNMASTSALSRCCYRVAVATRISRPLVAQTRLSSTQSSAKPSRAATQTVSAAEANKKNLSTKTTPPPAPRPRGRPRKVVPTPDTAVTTPKSTVAKAPSSTSTRTTTKKAKVATAPVTTTTTTTPATTRKATSAADTSGNANKAKDKAQAATPSPTSDLRKPKTTVNQHGQQNERPSDAETDVSPADAPGVKGGNSAGARLNPGTGTAPRQSAVNAPPGKHPKLPKIDKQPITPNSVEYKTAARKFTSAMVALPILLVTSYYLFDRLAMGNAPKDLDAFRSAPADPAAEPDKPSEAT